MSRPHPSHPDRASMNEREPPSVRVLPHLPPVEAEVPPGGERPSDGQGVEARWGNISISARGARAVTLALYFGCALVFLAITVKATSAAERTAGSLDRATVALDNTTRGLAEIAREAHEASIGVRAVREDELPRVARDVAALRGDVEALRSEVRAAVVRR